MTGYEELIRNITEYRVREHIKDEKKLFRHLKKEYKLSRATINAVVASLFLTHQKEGKLHQYELNQSNRMKMIDEITASELSRIQKIENKIMKRQLTNQIKEDVLYFTFFASIFNKHKKVQLTSKELTDILNEAWAGEVYTDTLKRKKRDTVGAIRREILMKTAAVSGATLPQIQEIVDRRLESTLKHSLLVYQNETTRKQEVSESLVSERLGAGGKVQFVAALDDRTCSLCGDKDGRVYRRGEEPFIPIHPRCRCTTVTVIDGWEQTLRSARDIRTQESYLTNDKTFKQWKKMNYR